MSLTIVKTGSTRPEIAARFGDYEDWFVRGLGIDPAIVDVVDARYEPLPDSASRVLVTGSPCNVTDGADWIEPTARWLADQVEQETPVLAICFGHQLLAHALGGRVEYNACGEELGTVTVRRLPASDRDPLLGDLPKEFFAFATHSQSVVDLPAGAELLATNEFDAHQAYRVGSCAWGLQFHPEFTEEIMRDHLERRRAELTAEDRDVDGLLAGLRPSPAHLVLEADG